MGATAKLMAMLGLDGRDFKKGITGATAETKKFGDSMRTTKRMIDGLLGMELLNKFLNALKQLRDFQNKTGTQIVSDESLDRIDSLIDKVETLKMTTFGYVGQVVSEIILGVEKTAEILGKLSTGDFKGAGASWLSDTSEVGREEAAKRLADKTAQWDMKAFKRKEKAEDERLAKLIEKEKQAVKEREDAKKKNEQFAEQENKRAIQDTKDATSELSAQARDHEARTVGRMEADKELAAIRNGERLGALGVDAGGGMARAGLGMVDPTKAKELAIEERHAAIAEQTLDFLKNNIDKVSQQSYSVEG